MAPRRRRRRQRETIQVILDSLYGDVAGLTSVTKLWSGAKLRNPDITLDQVKDYLKGQDSFTRHGNIRRKYLKRTVYVSKPGELLSADLGDFQALRAWNDGVAYLLVVIDCYSRKLNVAPIADKRGATVAKALDTILTQDAALGSRASLWTDEGTEFHTQLTRAVCQKHNINHYSTHNRGTKAVYAERVLKTLKSKLYRALTHFNTKNYIQFLERIVASYNASPHRGLLGDNPDRVHAMTDKGKIEKLADDMYEQKFRNFGRTLYKDNAVPSARSSSGHPIKAGDYVRVIGDVIDSAFVKSYEQVYTIEVFQVAEVILDTPPYYRLKDLAGEAILGTLYAQEMKLVDKHIFYDVEERLDTRRNAKTGKIEHLVRFKGYASHFNEWVPAERIKDI